MQAKNRFSLYAACVPMLAMAAPAMAQSADADKSEGIYAVARAGVTFDNEAKFEAADRTAPATFPAEVDHKRGFTGELGIGYDLGPVRLEATGGYSRFGVDKDSKDNAAAAGVVLAGRTRQFDLGVSAYVDFNEDGVIVPYLGGGIGAARVDGKISALGGTPASGSRFDDKDWGFRWHLDAGLALKAAPRTSIELGARYSRTSGLEFDGHQGPVAAGGTGRTYSPDFKNFSLMMGVRQSF
jgi:opacity protein-like surface antigen